MLKTRIIPVLLLSKGRMVKGVQFSQYRDVGDPVSACRIYNAQYADELVFIDIDATHENRESILELVKKVSEECFMPLTVGGGIRTIEDIRELVKSGADKVIITSALFENYDFLTEASAIFGEQCIIAGIDVKKYNGEYRVWSNCGRKLEPIGLEEHVKHIVDAGVGEVFVSSIDNDGGMQGYDLELLGNVCSVVAKPIIISGGAGNFEHLYEAIDNGAHAVGCASIFHFADNNPIRARSYLKNKGVNVKKVK